MTKRVLSGLLVIVLVWGLVAAASVSAGPPYDRFRALMVEVTALVKGTLIVNGATTLNDATTINGPLSVVGDATALGGPLTVDGVSILTGAVAANSGEMLQGFLVLTPTTSITVTQGMTITPTGTYQPLTAAGAVSTSAIAAKDAGTMLRLINTSAQTITLTDTGTLKLTANWVGAQYDALVLMSDGVNWVEMARADN
jgi:hypothetical protein